MIKSVNSFKDNQGETLKMKKIIEDRIFETVMQTYV